MKGRNHPNMVSVEFDMTKGEETYSTGVERGKTLPRLTAMISSRRLRQATSRSSVLSNLRKRQSENDENWLDDDEEGEGEGSDKPGIKSKISKLFFSHTSSNKLLIQDSFFLDDDEIKKRFDVGAHCIFILFNYLQQVAIISTPELIDFPPEWLNVFRWLSVTALFDLRIVFGAENDVARVFQIILASGAPLVIIGLIRLLLVESRHVRLYFLLGLGVASFTVVVALFAADTSQAIYLFLGSLAVLPFAYVLLRSVIVTWISSYYENMDYSPEKIDHIQVRAEVYVWLFVLVQVYSSVFKTGMSFIDPKEVLTENATAANSEGTLQAWGIVLPLLSSASLVLYVYGRARAAHLQDERIAQAQRERSALDVEPQVEEAGLEEEEVDEIAKRDYEAGKFLVKLFRVEYWWFQVAIIADKSILIAINLIGDKLLSGILAFVYIILVILFMMRFKPYENKVITGTKWLTAGRVDLWGRAANALSLLFVILLNVVQSDLTAARVLTVLLFAVSLAMFIFWIWILCYKLNAIGTITAFVLTLGSRRAYFGLRNEELEEKLHSKGNTPLPRHEVMALDPLQCKAVLESSNLTVEIFTSIVRYRQRDCLDVTRLDFQDELEFDERGLQVLVKYLRATKKLQTLRYCGYELPIHQLKGDETRVQLINISLGDIGALLVAILIQDNSVLCELNLSSNNISDVGARALGRGLARNNVLEYLNLGNNSIANRGAERIGACLGQNKSLRGLLLHNNRIGNTGAIAIGNALKANEMLRDLNLVSNNIGEEGASAIGAGLAQNESLNELNLSGSSLFLQELKGGETKVVLKQAGLGDLDALAIAPLIQANEVLTELNLTSNNIEQAGAEALGGALKKNRVLKKLYLGNNNIGTHGAESLAKALLRNKTLTTLNLQRNKIGVTGAVAFGSTLRENNVLRFLNLKGNDIGRTGARRLAKGVRLNRSLSTLILNGFPIPIQRFKGLETVIDFSEKELGDFDAAIIGQLLVENRFLDQLKLRSNRIGDLGAVELGRGLSKNNVLKVLDVRGNDFGIEGANGIGVSLAQNPSLTELNLSGPKLPIQRFRGGVPRVKMSAKSLATVDVVVIAHLIRVNRDLIELNLSGNIIDEDGARGLGRALPQNKTLTMLILEDSELNSDGARLLGEGLVHNRSLTALSLKRNSIGSSGAIILGNSLAKNRTLTMLDLEDNGIQNDGAEELGVCLTRNRAISMLNLSGYMLPIQQLKGEERILNLREKHLGNIDAIIIAALLEENVMMIELNLGFNAITSAGAEALGKSLGRNNTLKVLDMEGNNIGNIGALGLAEGLLENSSVTELNVSGLRLPVRSLKGGERNVILTQHAVSSVDAEIIALLVERNKDLAELNLNGTRLSIQKLIGGEEQVDVDALSQENNAAAIVVARISLKNRYNV